MPLTNSATLVHVSSTGSLIAEYPIPSNPDDAAVGPDGDIYITQVESGQITQFDPSTGDEHGIRDVAVPACPDLERRRRSLGW